ncbi:helix-turn-helix domain-containing protein [Actinoplanes sp. NPDC051861]|uniref:helix-turn-helix domain-containing protein n=1 Tax=Actinoplanes sp. NPDC051861 TaxID=3155170 RepID=UPI003428D6BA
MGKYRPVTEEEKDRVWALHADGLSRNAIAKEMKRGARTISKICDEAGLRFDAHRTSEAVQAVKDDARARRAALSLKLLDDAETLRTRMHQPHTVHRLTNDGMITGTISRPDPRDQRDLMFAAGIAIDKSLRLEEFDADPGINGAKSMLGALAKGLGEAYSELVDQPPSDGD